MLLCWALRKTNLPEIFLALRSANIPLLIAAWLIYSISYYIRSHRWRVLLKAQGVDATIPFLFKSYLVSIFFSNFLPSTIGGDAIRAFDVWRLERNKSIAVATVFVDRFLGLLGLILFAVGALLLSQKLIAPLPLLYPSVLLAAAIVFLLTGMIFIPSEKLAQLKPKIKLPLWQKLQQKLINIIKAFLAFGNRKDALAIALGLSLMVQISVIAHYYLIAKALDLSVPLQNLFLIIPLVTLIMVLPVSINAIGIRENAFVFFFGIYGYGTSRPETVAFAWLAYGIVIIQGLLGGIVYGLRK